MGLVADLRRQAAADEAAGTLYSHALLRRAADELERLMREVIEQNQPDCIIRSAMLLAAFREGAAGKAGALREAAVTMFGEDAVQRATAWFKGNAESR
jgi:hypothetical protein